MKNIEVPKLNSLENSHEIIEVPQDVDFVYIMRKDGAFVSNNLALKICSDSGLPLNQTTEIIKNVYEDFIINLSGSLATAFEAKGKIEIHLFESEVLEKKILKKAGVIPIISLDPLLFNGVDTFAVSRGFYLGGIEDFGQIARPGYESMQNQADKLSTKFKDCPVCVVEDDIFSGGSVINALTHLSNAGLKIGKLIPGFQIGKPTKLDAMGIMVDPVITYQTVDGSDIFAKVDLGDPRDYLMGASGLVVKLKNGAHGRVPYVLPYVSTSARASVPKENEISFGISVWSQNLKFFQSLEISLGFPVLLKHMDDYFINYMEIEEGVDRTIPMTQLVYQALESLTNI